MKTGIEIIAEERQRQLDVEGWTAEHDDEHDGESLLKAAICYASPKDGVEVEFMTRDGRDRENEWYKDKALGIPVWPWDYTWDKRKKHDKIKKLGIAGALICAEIDRELRKNDRKK